MTRKNKEGIIEATSRLPWFVGAGFSLVSLLAGIILSSFAAISTSTVFQGLAQLRWWLYAVALAFGVSAIFAVVRQVKSASMLRMISAKEQLQRLSWHEFEWIIQEYFRQQGYLASLTEDGPDDGVDVLLKKEGVSSIVQCKHWKSRKVGVSVVREVMGSLAVSDAEKAYVVTSGEFTEDAIQYAIRADVGLIDGEELVRRVSNPRPVYGEQKPEPCPRCGAALTRRLAMKGARKGKQFLGCSTFPKCRFTRQID